MVRPTVAVITNIGDAHIENLGNTRQGYPAGQERIFEHLQPGGLAVLNGDDALLAGLELPFETILCGRGELCRPGHGHRHHGVEGPLLHRDHAPAASIRCTFRHRETT